MSPVLWHLQMRPASPRYTRSAATRSPTSPPETAFLPPPLAPDIAHNDDAPAPARASSQQSLSKPARFVTTYLNGALLDSMELSCDRGEFGGVDVDEATVLALVLEADNAVHLGKEGVVFAAAAVCA